MTKDENTQFTRLNARIIDFLPENIAEYGVCGYKDAHKHLELRRKIDWYKAYYPKGLRIKGVFSDIGGYQGMIEYIPGAFAHRPVNADGYMFIHCLFVGFKKEYKGQGFATSLLAECIKEAKSAQMQGVAVVTRKGSFMAKRDIFIKNGFQSVDKAKPDFELLALKFDEKAPNPSFRDFTPEKYSDGITIFRSAQCPYSVKNVDAIIETAHEMNINTRLVELDNYKAAQNSPCPFGTFCIVNDGEVISHHPISQTRFINIMKSI